MSSLIINPTTGDLDVVLDKASEIKYDNTSSGLTATELQAAVDEVQFNIESLPSPIVYKGIWDASTNIPTLSNSDVGTEGFLYNCTVAGTVNFGAGPITFDVNDKVVSNGSVWSKWDQTDAVTSVNGEVGDVNLTTTLIPEGTNLYFTDSRAQDAVGALLTDTTTINLDYTGAGNTITADVVTESLTNTHISPTANIDVTKLGDGSVLNTEFSYLSGVSSPIQTQLDSKALAQPGDINPTSFSAAISPTAADITGAVFAGTVRSFVLEMDVVGSTSYEHYTIKGVQKASDWVISQSSYGDTAGITLSINSSGQLQYVSNETLTLKFAAKVIPA